jgi:hypothetical protein
LGGTVGLYAPIYRLAAPLFDALARTLAPLIKTKNRTSGEMQLQGGGGANVWNLEHSWGGRGFCYNLVIIDECAFTSPEMSTTWSAAIRPTMVDLRAPAILASTPAGIAEDNFFWRAVHEQSYNFTTLTAATHSNPFVSREEIEELRAQHNPLVFAQEFLATVC